MPNVYHSMIKDDIKHEFCPYCEQIRAVSLVYKKETLPVLGEPIEYMAKVFKCSKCNSEFAPTEIEEDNFRLAYNLYRKKHKLLTPEEIKDIRENYRLSQRNFSRFLRWGEITIHRYESGAIQDTVHNETLVLLKDNPYNALQIFELNRDNLPEELAQKVERRIKELIDIETETEKRKIFFDLTNVVENLSEKELTINSGYKFFDIDKFENLILYILQKVGGEFKTKLNKLLWYCDFKHFQNHAVSITGSKYVHLPYGPVPDNYDLHLWRLLSQNKIINKEVIFNETTAGEEFHHLIAANSSLFNQDEINTINYVLRKFSKLNVKQISKKSHDEKGYKETQQSEVISYSYALELLI